MPLFEFEGMSPTVHPEAFVAPTAVLIGDVTVAAGASVWFHAPPGIRVDIGPGATVAHMCTIHGVRVGAEALIANHCTVLDGAVIGARSLIAAHSLVVGGTEIPDGVLVTGAPAKVKGPIAGTNAEMWVNVNPAEYQALARRYREGFRDQPL
jgi:carbonic anhydrase/acetyltransferase-like protein (isoleucine patch superfamily)